MCLITFQRVTLCLNVTKCVSKGHVVFKSYSLNTMTLKFLESGINCQSGKFPTRVMYTPLNVHLLPCIIRLVSKFLISNWLPCPFSLFPFTSFFCSLLFCCTLLYFSFSSISPFPSLCFFLYPSLFSSLFLSLPLPFFFPFLSPFSSLPFPSFSLFDFRPWP